jgi:methyl-accepting chemotaxis protein
MRLLAGFMGVAVLVALAGGAGIVAARMVAGAGEKLVVKDLPRETAAVKAGTAIQKMLAELQQYQCIINVDPELEKAILANSAEQRMWVMARLHGTASTEFAALPEKALYDKIGEGLVVPGATPQQKKMLEEMVQDSEKLKKAIGEFFAAQKMNASLGVRDVNGEFLAYDTFLNKAIVEQMRLTKELQDVVAIGTASESLKKLTKDSKLFGLYAQAPCAIENEDAKKVFERFAKEYMKYVGLIQKSNGIADLKERMKVVQEAQAAGGKVEMLSDRMSKKIMPLFTQTNAKRTEIISKIKELTIESINNENDSMKEITAQIKTSTRDASRIAGTAVLFLGVLVLVGIVAAVLLGAAISTAIVKALNEVVGVSNKVASGDLRETARVMSKDELGTLAQNVNNMIGSLKDVISQVVGASTSVADGSTSIRTQLQQISDGAQQQAASFEELSSSIQTTASNAQNANEKAKIVRDSVEKTGKSMQEMSEAMGTIETSSRSIESMVTIITDIAEQTNLLALNAAIEAARAGEHGKGFAVVADEVRKLAERSASAAKDISRTINSTIKDIKVGAEVAVKADKELKDIVEHIRVITTQIAEISEAAQEQAAGMEQNTSITENNANAAEQLAHLSEEMQKQVDQLRDKVSVFKL